MVEAVFGMSKIILLDACFLIEFLAIPVDSDPDKHAKAVELISESIERGYDLFCTVGVLYEVANHIVDIKSNDIQRAIAIKFQSMVLSAWGEGMPFSIVPGPAKTDLLTEFAELPDLCKRYATSLRQRLSLVDCAVVDVAHALKASYQSRARQWPAHIWTMHAQLKALAPDSHEHEYF